MASWIKHDLGVIDTGQINSAVNAVDSIIDPLAAVLDVALAILDLVAIFVTDLPDALKLLVDAAITTLEQMILDLLQNNASIAVHINLNWNPHWKWKKKRGDPSRIVDFVTDSQLPFHGTGTSGWILDLGSAAMDESNVFRPYSDADSAVAGVIIVKGVPLNGDLQKLKALFDAFVNFDQFSAWLGSAEELAGELSDDVKSLLRLGPEAFDEDTRKVNRSFAERMGTAAIGTLVGVGLEGENVAGEVTFRDPSTTFAGILPGDSLSLSGGVGVYRILGITPAKDELTLTTPVLRGHGPTLPLGTVGWSIYRGGAASLLSSLPTTAGSFARLVPSPGNLPVWASVPVAGLIPAVGALIEALRDLVNGLRSGLSAADLLRQLIELLREKIRILKELLEEILELIRLVGALVAFFDESYMVTISVSQGGVGEFLNNAAAAENAPFFGTEGVVAGIVALTVSDNPSNHLQSFFELVGVKFQEVAGSVSAATDDVSSADQARQDTWDEHFP